MWMLNQDRFHLEITSIEEFVIFVALIRGETLEEDKLKALVAKLHAASDTLAAAEQADEKPHGLK
jgi:hypothetical protein